MKYKNAKAVLPTWLLKELQEYVCGEIIYVPGMESSRAAWGEANGTREKYVERNTEIISLHRSGESVSELAERYHLSEYSIRKIIAGCRKEAAEFAEVTVCGV